jgi:hypothetical protein
LPKKLSVTIGLIVRDLTVQEVDHYNKFASFLMENTINLFFSQIVCAMLCHFLSFQVFDFFQKNSFFKRMIGMLINDTRVVYKSIKKIEGV